MFRHSKANFLFNPFLPWSDFAVKTGEMMMASAQVIHHRTNRMATAGSIPSVHDQREFALMGQEKWEAMTESARAMAIQMMTMTPVLGLHALDLMMESSAAMLSLATSTDIGQSLSRQEELANLLITASTKTNSQLAGSAAKVAQHGLKPIHSRVTANAKRLNKL